MRPVLIRCACGRAYEQFTGCPHCKTGTHRDSARARGYSKRWDYYSRAYLANSPTCAMCGKRSEVVDHIQRHNNKENLIWSPKNHQALCRSCHGLKTLKD